MKKPSSILLLLLFLLFFSYPTMRRTLAQLLPIVVNDDQGAGNTTSQLQTYIVHVDEPAVGDSELLSNEDLESWYLSFLPNTTLDSGEPRLIYSYRHVLSGFAARLTPDELKAVESLDGFVFAHPDQEVVGQTTYTPQFLGLNQWASVWADSTQGEGVIVGVIDTGILPTHPSFQDDGTLPRKPRKWRGQCGFGVCNNKLIGATGFIRGAQTSPLDDNGHGTHTAGTAAGMPVYDAEVLGSAKGTASGTAPRAHVAAYKVLDRHNRGQDSDFLRGIEQAIIDGVDVLSMSLGIRAAPLPSSGIAIGSFAAIQNGIFPCAAAMNEGPTPSAISNDFPWGLTVGASTIDRKIGATVRLGNRTELDGQSGYQPDWFDSSVEFPLIYPGATNQQATLGCLPGSMAGINVTEKIVLCHTGGIEAVKKGEAVKDAGGKAMIIIVGQGQGFTTIADPHVIPTAQVSYADGQKIFAYMRTSPNPSATIVFRGTQFGASPSPAVASFSGRGPSNYNGGILKPDIIGPGVNILAAWPFEVGPNPTGTATSTFNFDSGTSMATPHLSGIAALLKKNHPTWSPAAIKSAIMTTAYKIDRDKNPITDQANNYAPARVFAMGAGHVNPTAANDPGLIYDLTPDDYVPYLCGMYGDAITQAITKSRVNCQGAGGISPEQLNYPSIAVTLSAATPTKYITRRVTNVGDANEVYSVTGTQQPGVAVQVVPDKLQFSQVGAAATFTVQFSLTTTTTIRGQTSEGSISWVSSKHAVTSTVVVTYY